MTEFHDAIRSPLTKSRYDKRLAQFFVKVGIKGRDLEKQARTFVAMSRSDPALATQRINDYLRFQKERA